LVEDVGELNSPAFQPFHALSIPQRSKRLQNTASLRSLKSDFNDRNCAKLRQYMNRPLRLFVYNHEYNVTRPVTITPTRSWGGEGALGCVLGFGALHRIPAPLEEPPHAPGETLFSSDSAFDEQRPTSSASPGTSSAPTAPPTADFLVPANMQFQSKSPPLSTSPVGAHGKPKKGRAHHAFASPTAGLDDYFKEGEQKSKEEDFAPSARSGSVPPPPKMGGPPRGGGPPKAATPVQKEDIPDADGA
jgi:hypothetical protein